MKTKPHLLALTAALLCAPAVHATDAPPAADAPPSRLFERSVVTIDQGGPAGIAVLSSVVKNLPYSAETVTERTQVLADGNEIASKQTRRVYRDSAGNTRQEVLDDDGKVVSVHIGDAEAQIQYTLKMDNRTAHKMTVSTTPLKNADEARAFMHKRLAAGDGKAVEMRNVQIALPPGGAKPAEALGQLGRMAGAGAFDRKWSGNSTVTKLGEREIDGVKAHGTGSSYTIPAGEIGNRRPIVVASETWFSPELRLVVARKQSDPRTGELSYRVSNIRRGEQPRSLFTVPEDFKIVDSKSFGFAIHADRKPN